LLEPIQAYRNKQKKQPTTKPPALVDLVAVTVYPSRNLWRMQLALYVALFVFSFIALLPFLFRNYYWACVWLLFSCGIFFAAYNSWRTKNTQAMQLEVIQNTWRLSTNGASFLVSVDADILVWQWVIIIPLRDNITRKKYYVIALRDSMLTKEWRRLRVWLKRGL
jgi:hypothetical protein